MDFVQDFRRNPSVSFLMPPIENDSLKLDALLAAVAETLCAEAQIEVPLWLIQIPATKEPYFV
jgi:hypothetical protein